MYRNNEEIEIDLLDLCSTFLKKWKPILCSMLLCGLNGAGIAVIKNTTYSPKVVTTEDIQKATALLTEDDAKEVRSVYRQYVSYTRYKESLQDYSNSLFINSSGSGYMKKISKYSVKSSAYGVSGLLADLSLSPEVLGEIKLILGDGKEDDLLIDINRYVTISYNDENTVSISNIGEQGNRITQAIITLSVIGSTKEQCDKISSLVDEALESQMNTVHKIDDTASLTFLGENYSDDLSGWLTSQQNESVSRLNNADEMLADTNTIIKELSSNQKKYYDLLVQRDSEDVFIPVSVLKYLLIGILIGFVISAGIITIRYLFDGTVKTGSELSWIINGNTPHALADSENTKAPDVLVHDNGTSVDLFVEDQTIKFSKLEKKTLYVVAEDKCYRNKDFNEAILKLKKTFFGDVRVGNPLESSEELQKLSQSEGAVLVVRLKSTKQKDVARINQYCQNYNVPINDVIVLAE